MADDAELRERANEVLTRADRHHWTYQWSWLGLPIIQMPEDIVLLQEVLWQTRPTIVIETGIARGGSIVFLASILELIGEGRVIGIDIELRPHNRRAILSHALARRIELVDGSSVADEVLRQIRARIGAEDRVMVILDSNHTHEHVYRELQLYAPLVTRGQFLVVSDTVIEDIPVQEHRPRPWGPGNNPSTALDSYLRESDAFARDPYFNGKLLLTSAPRGYLRRVR
ncbi:MAG TPA: CmcI family methyltransferase [Stellaceae bacterium]|nr:CmcI family methyltransferase [Stellaceae bacterium]